MSGILRPEWVNSAEKWLKPLITGASQDDVRRPYGIGGNESEPESIRQACVWALHLHRTRWPDALSYAEAYEALVAEVKLRRKRSKADRARVRPDPAVQIARDAPYRRFHPPLAMMPLVHRPSLANPEDAPAPRLRGPMFAGNPESVPVRPDTVPLTPVEDQLLFQERGARPGGAGHSPTPHYRDGRYFSSKAASDRAKSVPPPAPRKVQARLWKKTVTTSAQRGVTMGELAMLAYEFGKRRL